jgi:hypothetical protein
MIRLSASSGDNRFGSAEPATAKQVINSVEVATSRQAVAILRVIFILPRSILASNYLRTLVETGQALNADALALG